MYDENPFESARELGKALLSCDESLRYADAIAQYENNNITVNELIKARDDFYGVVATCAGIVFGMVGYEPDKANACGMCAGGGGCARQRIR
jgi:hypothetical protein